MSEPAAQPQNRPETGKPGEPGNKAGRQFAPGQSGNPGGRPKGIARRVRDTVGDDGALLVNVAASIASGHVLYIDPDTGERTQEKVTPRERMDAIRWLAERGFGKAPEHVPIEGGDPLELGPDPNRFSEDFEQQMDELRAKRLAREAAER